MKSSDGRMLNVTVEEDGDDTNLCRNEPRTYRFSIVTSVAQLKASVISAGFPGQSGGQAIGEALFGLINPSGKLTTTIYPGSYANGEPVKGMYGA